MKLNVQLTHNNTQVNSQEMKSNKKSELFFNIVNKKSDSTEDYTVKISKQERTTSSSESQRDITDDKYYKNAPEFKAFI